MSEPVKTNAEILANQQAFQEAYARAKAFFQQIDGVAGVGFGQKQTAAQYQDTIAIVVFVREKKSAAELPPAQQIPASFEGYPTDVRVIRQASFDACDNETEYDTIQGGIQIATPINGDTGFSGKGTLGCIVKRRNDTSRDNVYLLTNRHVLYDQGLQAGDYIYHPFGPSLNPKKFKPDGPVNALGPIQKKFLFGNVPFTPPGATTPDNFFADAATARIDIDSKCFGSRCSRDVIKYTEAIIDLQLNGANTVKGSRSVINDPSIINKKVFKVGRTTGRTVGIVRLVNAPVEVPADPNNPTGPKQQGNNTIEIDFDVTSTPNGLNCKGNARFTEAGDSGSAVLDEQGHVIGLHVLGGGPTSPSTSPSHACHIMPILDGLNIDIATSSSAHATNLVADDGGLGPAPVGPGSAGQVADGPALAAHAAAGGSDSAPGLPEVAPASEDELQHLYALRDQLCATEQGRALHDAFVEVRREIGYLVRNARPVKVVWHRHKGPVFFAHTLQHLRGGSAQMPQVVDGVTLHTLLTRMRAVLSTHGSHPLRAALAAHGDQLLTLVLGGASAHDYLAQLQQS